MDYTILLVDDEVEMCVSLNFYTNPLKSVEWEDNGMDREFGAKESVGFVRKNNFSPSDVAVDFDMDRKK